MTPRVPMLLLFLVPAVPFAIGPWFPVLNGIGVMLVLVVLIVGLVDLVLSPRLGLVDVSREVGDIISVGVNNAVRLRLKNRGPRDLTVELQDEPPEPSDRPDLPLSVVLRPNRERVASYQLEPHRRGRSTFGSVHIRCRSRLGLWQLQETRHLPQPVSIYPDVQQVHRVELLARMNRLAEAGVRMSRLRGRGNDFDRLREYRREDEYRSIDWKATARCRELVSREYVVEKNQNVLFLLDQGRSMCNEADGISHFDRALNAMIFLSHVALRQGDTVGVLTCSNQVERWVPPVRGVGAVRSIVRQTYDLKPVYEATDYEAMVRNLRTRYRKRSLVVLLTYALDDVHLKTISDHMRMLRRPHLVMGAFLRNVPLQERVESMPTTEREAFRIAAAADLLAAQSKQLAELEQSGLLIVDAVPERLSAELISGYLEVKARHLL